MNTNIMKISLSTGLAVIAAATTFATAPTAAFAQDWHDKQQNRQNTKNQWRNLSIAGGAATLFGLLKGDNTITFAGAAGTLYSLNRYEQDRKSQSKADSARAAMFSKPYFERDGHRYDRKLVTKNGQKYYQFVRHH